MALGFGSRGEEGWGGVLNIEHQPGPGCCVTEFSVWQHVYYNLSLSDSDRLMLLVNMSPQLISCFCGSWCPQTRIPDEEKPSACHPPLESKHQNSPPRNSPPEEIPKDKIFKSHNAINQIQGPRATRAQRPWVHEPSDTEPRSPVSHGPNWPRAQRPRAARAPAAATENKTYSHI